MVPKSSAWENGGIELPFTEIKKTKEEESLVESGEQPDCGHVRFDMPIRCAALGYLNTEFRREIHSGDINLVVTSIYVY